MFWRKFLNSFVLFFEVNVNSVKFLVHNVWIFWIKNVNKIYSVLLHSIKLNDIYNANKIYSSNFIFISMCTVKKVYSISRKDWFGIILKKIFRPVVYLNSN